MRPDKKERRKSNLHKASHDFEKKNEIIYGLFKNYHITKLYLLNKEKNYKIDVNNIFTNGAL